MTPDTGEVRNVDVPPHDEITVGTLHPIAEQPGAERYQEWFAWIDDHS